MAYELAKLGEYSTKPGVNVGCIIERNNKILSKGWYEKYGGSHAEINAIRNLKKNYPKSYRELLDQSSIYISLEPCSKTGKTPPCTDELKKYNFKEIIIGHEDPSQSGTNELKKLGFNVNKIKLHIIIMKMVQYHDSLPFQYHYFQSLSNLYVWYKDSLVVFR